MYWHAISLTVVLTSCSLVAAESAENNEKLIVEPLTNKLVHARFEFVTSTSIENIENGHYHLFPKALGEVLSKYEVDEMDVTLTQGIWRYRYWGIPLEGASNPSGASIMVIFKHGTKDVDRKWKGLVNSLAGLICASLNFADEKRTTVPHYTFNPRGAVNADRKFDLSLLRYVNLPEEFVCTENLTPWKKLLPCFGKAGLSSLLAAKPLFDSNYHSISISVRPVCSNEQCDSVKTQLTQALSVVLDHTRGSYGDNNKFSIKSLFGKPVPATCAVATTSKVIIKSPETGILALSLNPPSSETSTTDAHIYSAFSLTEKFDVSASYKSQFGYVIPDAPMLYAHRYLSGYGQELGAIVCEITNNAEEDVQIIYTDNIPWYLRMYLHTLSLKSSTGTTIKPSKVRLRNKVVTVRNDKPLACHFLKSYVGCLTWVVPKMFWPRKVNTYTRLSKLSIAGRLQFLSGQNIENCSTKPSQSFKCHKTL